MRVPETKERNNVPSSSNIIWSYFQPLYSAMPLFYWLHQCFHCFQYQVLSYLLPRSQQINTEVFWEQSLKHFPFQQAPRQSVIVQQLLKVVRKFLPHKNIQYAWINNFTITEISQALIAIFSASKKGHIPEILISARVVTSPQVSNIHPMKSRGKL